MSLVPYSGPWTDREIAHLLRRTMFGLSKEDLSYFRDSSIDFQQAIDILFDQGPEPAPPINDYNHREFDPDVEPGKTWIYAERNLDVTTFRILSLRAWWMRNMIQQSRSIHEKMIYFWYNHLPIHFFNVYHSNANWQYVNLLRTHALGNFKTFIRELTLNPAMLLYLNGQFNTKEAPDENYARELQELFCIGKGPEANYTEGDVQAAARVLTGWRFRWASVETTFTPGRHNTEDKTFSSFYGNRTIKGRAGEEGAEELDELLDMIFENNETALFVCRKIYTFFVAPEISESVENAIIKPLAELFRNSNYEIEPVVRALISSEHFFEASNRGAMIKSPFNYFIGHIRSFGMQLKAFENLEDHQRYYQRISDMLYVSGQVVGAIPNVAGWPAYYQKPSLDKIWINTGTIQGRTGAIDYTFWGEGLKDYSSFGGKVYAENDYLSFTASLDDPFDPNALLDEAAFLLLGTEISDSVKEQLKSALLGGQAGDYVWTDAWVDYVNSSPASPNYEEVRSVVQNRLRWFYVQLTQLAEYHIM